MAGGSNFFNVAQFQETFAALVKENVDERLASQPVDICTDECYIATEFESIQHEINTQLKRTNVAAKPVDPKPGVKTLVSEDADLRNVAAVDKRKEVNYITTFMKTQQLPTEEAPIAADEVVLSVALYHPKHHTKTQEFLVLGSQSLSELRDRFYCLSDHIADGPETPSGFFFIENVFYNDMRQPKSLDYSQPIIQWVNEQSRFTQPSLGVYSARKMESTLFRELSIRLGAQYLYVHQGNCEHRIVFTEMRLIHDQDVQNRLAYPLHTFQAKVRKRRCGVCNLHAAKYITLRDPVSEETPMLYCAHCYRPMHYTEEGALLYEDFEVYPYFHD